MQQQQPGRQDTTWFKVARILCVTLVGFIQRHFSSFGAIGKIANDRGCHPYTYSMENDVRDQTIDFFDDRNSPRTSAQASSVAV